MLRLQVQVYFISIPEQKSYTEVTKLRVLNHDGLLEL